MTYKQTVKTWDMREFRASGQVIDQVMESNGRWGKKNY